MSRRELKDGEARSAGEVGGERPRQRGRNAALRRRPRVEMYRARGRDRERQRNRILAHLGSLIIAPRHEGTGRHLSAERLDLPRVPGHPELAASDTSGRAFLIEEPALKKAEAECLADAEARARRRARETERRAVQDEALARSMAAWPAGAKESESDAGRQGGFARRYRKSVDRDPALSLLPPRCGRPS